MDFRKVPKVLDCTRNIEKRLAKKVVKASLTSLTKSCPQYVKRKMGVTAPKVYVNAALAADLSLP